MAFSFSKDAAEDKHHGARLMERGSVNVMVDDWR